MSERQQVMSEALDAIASGRTTRSEIFEACPTATDPQQVSDALYGLRKKGVIARDDTRGTWRLLDDHTTEPNAQPTPTPNPVATDPAPPAAEPQPQDDPLITAIHRMTAVPAVQDAERKARVLNTLADWPALDGEVALYLRQIASDIRKLA